MALPIARLGDQTSHGGVVICASDKHTIMGIGIARVGDQVNCPQAGHGVNKIVEGAGSYTIGGREVALHGHRCECGCTLIASLRTATHG